MVYIDEDFYSTMVGNQSKGNNAEVKGQIISEIADLIAFSKPEVIEALNASGVFIKENASDQKVIDALIDNVQNNRKLQAGLGFLIVKKQASSDFVGENFFRTGATQVKQGVQSGTIKVEQPKSEGGFGAWLSNLFKGDGQKKSSGATAGVGGAAAGAAGGAGAGPIGAIIGAVAGAVGSVFNFKAAQTNAQAEADKQRMELAQEVLKRKGGGSNTGLYVGLGLLAVAVIIVVIVKTRKK